VSDTSHTQREGTRAARARRALSRHTRANGMPSVSPLRCRLLSPFTPCPSALRACSHRLSLRLRLHLRLRPQHRRDDGEGEGGGPGEIVVGSPVPPPQAAALHLFRSMQRDANSTCTPCLASCLARRVPTGRRRSRGDYARLRRGAVMYVAFLLELLPMSLAKAQPRPGRRAIRWGL
jgi:hypothetical protein